MIGTRRPTAAEPTARAGNRAPVTASTPPSCAETIAAHMLDIAAFGDGACRDQDLALRGFTSADMQRDGAEANRIALRRSGGGSC